MSVSTMGSFVGDCIENENILETIQADIKENKKSEYLPTPFMLQHIRINSDPNMKFLINGYIFETDEGGIFCTPNNDESNLVKIAEFICLQDCQVEIYYLR